MLVEAKVVEDMPYVCVTFFLKRVLQTHEHCEVGQVLSGPLSKLS
jgi:hypothetical protein